MAKVQTRERDIEEDREEQENKVVDQQIEKALAIDPEDEIDDNALAEAERKKKGGAVETDEVGEDQDARLAYDLEGEDSQGPQERDSRRRRRNRARREAQQQSQSQIAALSGEVSKLKGMLDQMSQGQVHLAAGDLDGRISSEQQRLQVIDNALAKAVKDGDDVTYAKAMGLRDEARDRLQQLGYAKQRLVADANDPRRAQPQNNGLQREQTQVAPDPRAAAYAERFMERNEWFDPRSDDEDSVAAKRIDAALWNEGYKPHTSRYWIEFERRTKAAGLGDTGEGDDMNDEQDGAEQRQERRIAPRNNGGLPPRAGRGNGGGQRPGEGFKLTEHMREALDAENLLDEKSLTPEQKAYRRKLVTTWRDATKKATSAAGAR